MRCTVLVVLCITLVGGARADTDEGWLGVELQTLTDELRLVLDVPEEGGVLINRVVEGSPAAEAGLRRRDFILRFDNEEVDGPQHLGRLVRSAPPGDRVVIAVIRDGSPQDVTVTLGSRPDTCAERPRSRKRKGLKLEFFPGPRARLGVRIVEIGKQMAEFLEAPEAEGVLVLEVEEDGPAEKGGVRAGDIITAVDGEDVVDASDLVDLLKEAEEGESLRLSVVRKGRATELEIEVEEIEEAPDFWHNFRDFFRGWPSHRELRCPHGWWGEGRCVATAGDAPMCS
jgi:serine protease Do